MSRCQRADINSGEPNYPQIKSMQQQVPEDKELQTLFRQPDYPIVSGKSLNRDGEQGIATMRRGIRNTSAALRGGVQISTKLMSLTKRAKENSKLKFTSLAHLLTEDFLSECLGGLKKDKASGIDGVRVEEYGADQETNIKDLVKRLKSNR